MTDDLTTQVIAGVIATSWEAEQRELAEQRQPAPVVSLVHRRMWRVPAWTDGVLRTIPPAKYVEVLCGIEPPAHGMINCPLPGHDDHVPSLKVYGEPERGVYCFGCGRGGDIFAFAAELWGMSWRTEFLAVRRRLAVELLRAAQ
jgi:hypothetical protein